ncbi:DUF6907 domain-containing protein [Streptomyces sp. 900116325]
MGHEADGVPGWHQGPTADVIATAHGVNARHGDPLDVLLSARVTQTNEDAEAFGIETRIWFDTGTDTAELDLTQTGRLIDGLEKFLPALRAMRDHLAEASAGDHPGDPVAQARIRAAWDAERAARA